MKEKQFWVIIQYLKGNKTKYWTGKKFLPLEANAILFSTVDEANICIARLAQNKHHGKHTMVVSEIWRPVA